MAKYISNLDRMLQAVLRDTALVKAGNYDPADYQTVDDALYSDNIYVTTVAKIISDKSQKMSNKEIYNEVCNYLKSYV